MPLFEKIKQKTVAAGRAFRSGGPALVWRKVRGEAVRRLTVRTRIPLPKLPDEVLLSQRTAVFERKIKFSVLVPLYNTPLPLLGEMIESVTAQTYPDFELCLADGSDDAHPSVERVCREYAEADGRIKYRRLAKNGGISDNTNQCIDMASGDYFVLLDHDDLLMPQALFECMHEVCGGADFIYTDEASFYNGRTDRVAPAFKPDFSPDLLRSCNYICHLSVFSRELYNKVGGFDPSCDGSQDYDMILRLCERAEKIAHIPKILYLWRVHDGSVAKDLSVKPYVLEAARRALGRHLERAGAAASVSDAVVQSTYDIDYAVVGQPLVSACVGAKDGKAPLPCIEALLNCGYENIEIVLCGAEYDGEKVRTGTSPEDCRGEHILFIDPDVEVCKGAVNMLLMHSAREGVGAVGGRLLYRGGTVSSAGLVVGVGDGFDYAHRGRGADDIGYAIRLKVTQNMSALPASMLMTRTAVFRRAGGWDDGFSGDARAADYCMRLKDGGYLTVMEPRAEAVIGRGERKGEADLFIARHPEARRDPYYNPNLNRKKADFGI